MKERDTIKELLEKYKLARPLPDRQKKEILREKKKSLIAIFRKKKKLSALIFLALTLYFWVKRFGLSISLGNSAVIVLAAMIIAFGAVATGAYYSFQGIMTGDEKGLNSGAAEGDTGRKDNSMAESAAVPEPETKPQISIVSFEYDEEIADIGRQVNRSIASELIRLKGSARVALVTAPRNIKTSRVVSGSVMKIGNAYRITAKIIDRSTSRVIFLTSGNAESVDGVSQVCSDLARQLASRM